MAFNARGFAPGLGMRESAELMDARILRFPGATPGVRTCTSAATGRPFLTRIVIVVPALRTFMLRNYMVTIHRYTSIALYPDAYAFIQFSLLKNRNSQ